MDVNAFVRSGIDGVAGSKFSDIGRVHDIVQRPTLLTMCSCDFLFHGCQKALWVVKTSHPKRSWSSIFQPGIPLIVPGLQCIKPQRNVGQHKGKQQSCDGKHPHVWYLCRKQFIDTDQDCLRHCDFTFDGQLYGQQIVTD